MIVHIFLACLLAAWFMHNIDPVLGWDDIVNLLGVKRVRNYSMLGILCLAMIAYLLIKRVLGRGKKDD